MLCKRRSSRKKSKEDDLSPLKMARPHPIGIGENPTG
jgi:hypothetical protein